MILFQTSYFASLDLGDWQIASEPELSEAFGDLKIVLADTAVAQYK